ncbi:MAG: hypothetical protein CTY19_01180 [Methylomonas sp.]|jgi:hypothetical protein|nr:MAG: hypothetical protein CTY19_01180 [Methylomonas sp.]
MVFFKKIISFLLLCFLMVFSTLVSADERAEIQKRLNEQVLDKAFSVESEANLKSYIEDATKRGLPPKSEPSKYWRRGYTCGDLRRYSWNDYRDCRYFNSYYGYNWPY